MIESKHAYVNPGVELDAASAAQTRLTADLIKSQGVPFPEALNQVSLVINLAELPHTNSDQLFISLDRW